MKGQLMKEIHRLTRLIEERKKMTCEKLNSSKDSCYSLHDNAEKANVPVVDNCAPLSNDSSQLNKQFATANVHVNPNFKIQNSVIHINPRIQTTRQIHVNPRIVKDVSGINDSKYSYSNVKCSVYVNPKLMTKLSSSMQSKIGDNEMSVPTSPQTTCSHLRFVKNMGTSTMGDKKHSNSNMVVLSRRKLIRVRRTTKGSSTTPIATSARTKKIFRSPFKKVKFVPLKTIQTGMIQINALESSNKSHRSFESSKMGVKCGRYKIDRTNRSTSIKPKQASAKDNPAIVTIGGILYKSSRNQLVRRSLSVKRKRLGNTRNDEFVISSDGKHLHQLKTMRETTDCIGHQSTVLPSIVKEDKSGIGLSQKINYKNIMSTKAKRRSIQILWNKMRKNNQPCLLFKRFGYCANNKNGVCPKLHDRKQVSLCKKFLQGKCLVDNCSLSHDVGPEKMPTCKYFLEGCCTRDACPYLHVKMSSNTSICIEFLQGYCVKGNECKRRHEYTCPEFDKSRKCSKGKYCLYPHKSQTCAIGHTDKHLQTESKGSESKFNIRVGVAAAAADSDVIGRTKATSDIICATIPPSTHENRLRYYERTDTLNDDIDEKRKCIMKKINMMKCVKNNQQSHARHDVVADTTIPLVTKRTGLPEVKENELNQSAKIQCVKPVKRRPIGSLPAYIPID